MQVDSLKRRPQTQQDREADVIILSEGIDETKQDSTGVGKRSKSGVASVSAQDNAIAGEDPTCDFYPQLLQRFFTILCVPQPHTTVVSLNAIICMPHCHYTSMLLLSTVFKMVLFSQLKSTLQYIIVICMYMYIQVLSSVIIMWKKAAILSQLCDVFLLHVIIALRMVKEIV